MIAFLLNNKIYVYSAIFYVFAGLLLVNCADISSSSTDNKSISNGSKNNDFEIKLTNDVIMLAIILSMIVLLTIFGNMLVIMAIFCDFHLRSPTHLLMGSLAFADFLFAALFAAFLASYLFALFAALIRFKAFLLAFVDLLLILLNFLAFFAAFAAFLAAFFAYLFAYLFFEALINLFLEANFFPFLLPLLFYYHFV